jgi:predicted PolB exonuclease-like 3'-5' exonuclease
MDGSAVHAAVLAGRLEDVRHYCETDVMNTYLLYLRFRLLRGELAAGEYAKEISVAREKIVALQAPHWQEFIAAWDANATG